MRIRHEETQPRGAARANSEKGESMSKGIVLGLGAGFALGYLVGRDPVWVIGSTAAEVLSLCAKSFERVLPDPPEGGFDPAHFERCSDWALRA